MRPELLEIDRDKAFIISRVLFYTTKGTFEEDIEKLERIYSKEDILYYFHETTEIIGNNVSMGVAKRYNAPLYYVGRKLTQRKRNFKRAYRIFGGFH